MLGSICVILGITERKTKGAQRVTWPARRGIYESLLIWKATTRRMQMEKPVTTSALITGIWLSVVIIEDIFLPE